jgi:predicted metal-dependent phosphoesterase TrpH
VESGAARSFVDLHCHTSASFDSLSDPRAVVAAAAARGITHLAVTDHERIEGALAARDAAPAGVKVIVGEEVRTSAGDMIGLFLERAVPRGLSPAETAAAIREQGGLVGLPHPFDRFRRSGANAMKEAAALAKLASLVDYVEAHNARAIGGANVRAAQFAHDHGLAAVAASDAHSVMEVGVAYTVVPGTPDGAAELREALRTGRLVTGRSSYLVRTWTPIAKLVNRARGNRRQALVR